MSDDTISQVCLIRDGYRCFRCGTPVTSGETFNCHHRLFAGRGGQDTLDNRLIVCGSGNTSGCHGWIHGNSGEAAGDGNGWAISQFDTRPPVRVPARHWEAGLVHLTPEGDMIRVADVAAWTVDGLRPLTESDIEWTRQEAGHGK